jgi:hypothetical protein
MAIGESNLGEDIAHMLWLVRLGIEPGRHCRRQLALSEARRVKKGAKQKTPATKAGRVYRRRVQSREERRKDNSSDVGCESAIALSLGDAMTTRAIRDVVHGLVAAVEQAMAGGRAYL